MFVKDYLVNFFYLFKKILQLYRSRRVLWRTFGWRKNEKSCYSHYSSNQNKYCRKNIYNFFGRLSNHGFNCSCSKFRYKNMPLKIRTSSIMMDPVNTRNLGFVFWAKSWHKKNEEIVIFFSDFRVYLNIQPVKAGSSISPN